MRYMPANLLYTMKDNHTIDESLIEKRLFKSKIETECLRYKIPLYITIDSINEEYITSEEYFQ